MSILDYIERIKQENEGGRIGPRTMAQEPRNMYNQGQLVRNTADGSRPGYNGKENYALGLSQKEYKKKYYEDTKKEQVKTEAGKLAKERDKKLKNFIGKKKKIKASVLKDFILDDIGYTVYDSAKIKAKFPKLIIEQDLQQGDWKPLTKNEKTIIKESFDLPEGVKDWNFKTFKYGISSDKHMNLVKQMERKLGGGQKFTIAASFETPQGWMMGAMERVYENQTTLLEDGTRVLKKGVKRLTYEPITNKKGIIVGFKDNTAAGDGKI